MNIPYDETNPPFQNTSDSEKHLYQGHESLATACLVLGILSLVFICCFPPISLLLGSLGLLLGTLSKGCFARPKNAKVGTGLSAAAVSIVLAICVVAFTVLFTSPNGREALRDYMDILGSGNTSPEEINEFLNKYYNNNPYSDDGYSDYDYNYDYFDDYNNDSENGGFDTIPYYESEPDSGSNTL